jgi:IclR family acetate operon transcriptional repressor
MAKIENDPAAPRRPRGRPRAFADKTDQNTVKSLDRALLVLETLARLGAATLSELARELGEAPATIYRVLVTMEGRGLVEADPATQGWQVGPGAFLIGSAFLRRTSLVERSRPVLRALMESTGETANLGIAREGHVLFLGQVETHAAIRAFFPPGTLSPLHASGIGKALLAQFDEARLGAFLDSGALKGFTDHTLTDPDRLRADLRDAARQGYAVDDEERNEGMRCVAAPVFDAHGEAVAGISVSGPTSRIAPGDVPRLGAQVRDAAQRLSAALGAPPPTRPPAG